MKKKGQVAMESLMVYGIALLIVALAIGALIYFGVLDLGGLLPDKCDIKGGTFTCKEYAVFADGTIQIELQNTYGKNVEKVNVQLDPDEDSIGIIKEDCDLTPADQTVVNGATKKFESSGCAESADALADLIGKKVRVSIAITWNTAGSEITKTSYGSLQATVSE